MTHPYIAPVDGNNKLLASLSPLDECHILNISLSRTRLAAGAAIFDGEIDRVLFIERGLVSPMVITSRGDSLGIAIIGSEGAVGLLGVGPGDYSFQFRALTEVEALQISAGALNMACSRSGGLERLLRNYSQSLLKDAIFTMACHYHHGLDERLPQWLLIATERIGANSLVITQDILAEAHGVTISAISHALEALQRKGLIHHERGQVTLLNRKRLRSSACQCYPAAVREKKYVIKTHSL